MFFKPNFVSLFYLQDFDLIDKSQTKKTNYSNSGTLNIQASIISPTNTKYIKIFLELTSFLVRHYNLIF